MAGLLPFKIVAEVIKVSTMSDKGFRVILDFGEGNIAEAAKLMALLKMAIVVEFQNEVQDV